MFIIIIISFCTLLCRMKMQECKRKNIYSVGFIDPDKVHIETLTHKAEETMNNLLRFIKEQHYCDHILFPYNFK
jgi:DNA recombination-dependent growth factor C